MSKRSAKDKILDNGYENIVVFDNVGYDDALIGVSEDGRAIYDYDLMVKWLVDNDNMTISDAVEWIDYNTIRALPYAGEKAPIVMYRID